jgi:hypothetical protein
MELHQVKYSDLSSISHTIFVSEHEQFQSPEFLVIRYSGEYRIGSAGNPDAKYIFGTAAGAHAAWQANAVILDFTDLSYTWGDAIEMVLSIGLRPELKTEFPVVIIVGERCREALQSLLTDGYSNYCVGTLDEALELARKKIRQYQTAVEEYRRSLKRGDGG